MKTFIIYTSNHLPPVTIKDVTWTGPRTLGNVEGIQVDAVGGTKHWIPYHEITRLSEYDQPIEKTCDDMGPG